MAKNLLVFSLLIVCWPANSQQLSQKEANTALSDATPASILSGTGGFFSRIVRNTAAESPEAGSSLSTASGLDGESAKYQTLASLNEFRPIFAPYSLHSSSHIPDLHPQISCSASTPYQSVITQIDASTSSAGNGGCIGWYLEVQKTIENASGNPITGSGQYWNESWTWSRDDFALQNNFATSGSDVSSSGTFIDMYLVCSVQCTYSNASSYESIGNQSESDTRSGAEYPLGTRTVTYTCSNISPTTSTR